MLLAVGWTEHVQAQSIKDILNSDAAQKVLNAVKQINALKIEDFGEHGNIRNRHASLKAMSYCKKPAESRWLKVWKRN